MENEKMVSSLSAYCKSKNITIYELGQITGVNKMRLYAIAKNPKTNVLVSNIDKIYKGTKLRFGKGLTAGQYLDFECFKDNS